MNKGRINNYNAQLEFIVSTKISTRGKSIQSARSDVWYLTHSIDLGQKERKKKQTMAAAHSQWLITSFSEVILISTVEPRNRKCYMIKMSFQSLIKLTPSN